MPCAGKVQRKSDCTQHFWRMKFSAKDAHSAVTVQVKTDPSGLTCSPKTTDDKDVICRYQYVYHYFLEILLRSSKITTAVESRN